MLGFAEFRLGQPAGGKLVDRPVHRILPKAELNPLLARTRIFPRAFAGRKGAPARSTPLPPGDGRATRIA
jgi:hypothetical protein